MGKSIVVVSAVNFTTGGPFTILKKFLAATNNKENVSFIALVHSAKELKESYPWVKFIEFPEVKGSWLKRLHFEYVVCKKLSKELNATHWICLHDITANVVTKKDMCIVITLPLFIKEFYSVKFLWSLAFSYLKCYTG